jgi:hypothetical protein
LCGIASNGVYEVDVGMSFKNLNNMKSCIPLDASTLNPDYKIDSIHFIWNIEDPIPLSVRSHSPSTNESQYVKYFTWNECKFWAQFELKTFTLISY